MKRGWREEQKRKLEQQYKSCDAKLDKLVAKNQNDLSNVMQTYSTLSSRLHKARNKLSTVREVGVKNYQKIVYVECESPPIENFQYSF